MKSIRDRMGKRRFTFSWVYIGIVIAVMTTVHSTLLAVAGPRQVAYSDLLERIRAGDVQEVEIDQSRIVARLKAPASADVEAPPDKTPADRSGRASSSEGQGPGPGDRAWIKTPTPTLVATRIPLLDDPALLTLLRDKNVKIVGRIEEPSVFENVVLGWILPLGLMFAFYAWMYRRMGRGGPLSFGKSGAKLVDQNAGHRTTFADVAGVDEAKAALQEAVDFLKDPKRFESLGARLPRGVLLAGPPGTGKTLLARAVAGEAGVPFFAMSGSEFVEMFVGMGAARVRDLFAKAKERAPCIVFIDEIDTIGKSRGGAAAMAVNDEREQTLNQLLVEMDGFESNTGVLLMAATNRPELLDPALQRAGRFDRQVVVDRPDVGGREAILRVHTRNMQLSHDVDLAVIARRTPGAVGADLANIANEAALYAARRGAKKVAKEDFEAAVDRVQLGLEKRGGLVSPELRRRVAVHEAGHALVALSLPHADPVHRVSIVPRSIGALGVTLQLPTDDKVLATKAELEDRVAVLLGGREAEALVLGDVSTGAANDLERATQVVREMVTRHGMSKELGLAHLGSDVGPRFLGGAVARDFSDETQRLVDETIRAALEEQRRRAAEVLSERREELDKLVQELITREDLSRDEIEELLDRPLNEKAA